MMSLAVPIDSSFFLILSVCVSIVLPTDRALQGQWQAQLGFRASEYLSQEHGARGFPDNRACCDLYIRTDLSLWNSTFLAEGQRDDDATEEAIIARIRDVVSAANNIIGNVAFRSNETNETYQGLRLIIRRVTITRPQDCKERPRYEEYLCVPETNVSIFLSKHALLDASEYCLAYTFTATDFHNGVMGYAYVGNSSAEVSGGLCSRRDQRRGESHNGGIVTTVNYGGPISAERLQLVFTHEIGHNLGSSHDPDPTNERDGYFVMHSNALNPAKSNARRFSPSSIDQMSAVVTAIVDAGQLSKDNCLKKCTGSYCGNRIVEAEEQCDCGFGDNCDRVGDKCCYPADSGELGCRLKPTAVCSPSQGTCCDSGCQYRQSDHICHHADPNECIRDVFCDGFNAHCPLGRSIYFKKDLSFCNAYTGVCDRGNCNGSICLLLGPGWDQCYLDDGTREKMCRVACKRPGGVCVDTFDMGNNLSNPGSNEAGFWIGAGEQCANGKGYCDHTHRCQFITENDSPLRNILSLLGDLTNHAIDEHWLEKAWAFASLYWYLILLAAVALIALCGILSSCSRRW